MVNLRWFVKDAVRRDWYIGTFLSYAVGTSTDFFWFLF